MSFILDALKKSEAERQRQAGPTLLEVRITRPHRRYPTWAAIVGVLLGVNVVVLVAFVLHRPSVASPERAAEVQSAAPAAAGRSVPQTATGAAVGGSAAATPTATVAHISAPGAAGVAPLSAPLSTETGNPADEEPAVAPGSVHVERAGPGNYATLPSISEIGGNVPALQLDLLDYSERPSERYALINMHRVREGDLLPEGPRVLAITRDGVALDYRGQDFMLRPGATQ